MRVDRAVVATSEGSLSWGEASPSREMGFHGFLAPAEGAGQTLSVLPGFQHVEASNLKCQGMSFRELQDGLLFIRQEGLHTGPAQADKIRCVRVQKRPQGK